MPSDLLPTKRELLLRRSLYTNPEPDTLASVLRQPRRLLPVLTFLALTLIWLLRSFSSASPHPIQQLIREATAKHAAAEAAHPTTLRQAFDSYVALNGRLPPRGFDTWFHLSKHIGACRLSGFKEMSSSLAMWWALEPAEIRARNAALAMEDHKKMGWVRIRDGRVRDWDEMVEMGLVTGPEGQTRWKGARSALEEMLQEVDRNAVWLPDGQWRAQCGWTTDARRFPHCLKLTQLSLAPAADFFVNNLDEPSVIVPYELRKSLEDTAKLGKSQSHLLLKAASTLAFAE